MWTKFKAWCERQSSYYPARWYWPCVRIYGGPEGSESRQCYMTRIMLSPPTRWGQLYLHIFHREDIDRDPHDHPFSFWTIPLNTGYYEEVYEHGGSKDSLRTFADPAVGCFSVVYVPRFRISRRDATHSHRITSTKRGGWPLVTLVWRGPSVRKWGFWCHTPADPKPRLWVYYRNYLDRGATEGPSANVEGDDRACPGERLNLLYHTKDRNPA